MNSRKKFIQEIDCLDFNNSETWLYKAPTTIGTGMLSKNDTLTPSEELNCIKNDQIQVQTQSTIYFNNILAKRRVSECLEDVTAPYLDNSLYSTSLMENTQTKPFVFNYKLLPILKRHSDSELSSMKEFNVNLRKEKSVGNVPKKFNKIKSVNTVTICDTITLKDSHSNLTKNGPAECNLQPLKRTLKGSYTSLRPSVNRNLPKAPPPLNSTLQNKQAVTEVSSIISKHQETQRTALPRPITGIPRSTFKSSRPIRTISKSSSKQGGF